MFGHIYSRNIVWSCHPIKLLPLQNSLPWLWWNSLLMTHSRIPAPEIAFSLRPLPCPQIRPSSQRQQPYIDRSVQVWRPDLFAHEICWGLCWDSISIQPLSLSSPVSLTLSDIDLKSPPNKYFAFSSPSQSPFLDLDQILLMSQCQDHDTISCHIQLTAGCLSFLRICLVTNDSENKNFFQRNSYKWLR